MNKINIKTKLFAGVCAMLLMGTTVVSAREVDTYNLIMPRFGGITKTDSLYKSNQSRAVNNNTSVGGGYTMHSAIYRGENKMTSTYSAGSGDRIYLNYNSPSDAQGSNLRLGGWTGLSTYVKVQTTGSWSPDEY
ncbi:TPA: hypothetical protein ACGMLK_000102 [Streptococcus agalactiae]